MWLSRPSLCPSPSLSACLCSCLVRQSSDGNTTAVCGDLLCKSACRIHTETTDLPGTFGSTDDNAFHTTPTVCPSPLLLLFVVSFSQPKTMLRRKSSDRTSPLAPLQKSAKLCRRCNRGTLFFACPLERCSECSLHNSHDVLL